MEETPNKTETLAEERERFLSIVQSLEAEIYAAARENAGLAEQNSRLETDVARLEDAFDKQRSELESTRETLETVRAQLEIALDERAAAQSERDMLAVLNAKQTGEIRLLKRQIATTLATFEEWLGLMDLMEGLSPFSAGYIHVKLEKQRLSRLTKALLKLGEQAMDSLPPESF